MNLEPLREIGSKLLQAFTSKLPYFDVGRQVCSLRIREIVISVSGGLGFSI